MKILLLEDDMTLLEILEEHLINRGHQVVLAENGLEAEDIVAKERFDLLLLDVNVPYLSGFEFLKNLRSLGNSTPAIFITSLNTSKSLCYGFSIGADDYIKKPFDFDELDARLANISRKLNRDSIIEIDKDRYFEPQSNLIITKEGAIALRKKESEILLLLLERRGKIVQIDEMISKIWELEEPPLETTIRTYIKNIRKILGDDIIVNIRGVGYRFK